MVAHEGTEQGGDATELRGGWSAHVFWGLELLPDAEEVEGFGGTSKGWKPMLLRAVAADCAAGGGGEGEFFGTSAEGAVSKVWSMTEVGAKLEFDPKKKAGVAALLFGEVEQLFAEFEETGVRGFFGEGFVEEGADVGGGLHGAPVGAEGGARVE